MVVGKERGIGRATPLRHRRNPMLGPPIACLNRRPLLAGLLLLVTTALSLVSGALQAGASQSPRFPFDLRYPQVACLSHKPQTTSATPTIPANAAELLAMAHGHFYASYTCSWGYLVVLTPGSEALADQIRARFGPAVQVFIGPDPSKPTWSCWPFLKSTKTPRGLQLSLHLNSATVRAGSDFGGNLTVGNQRPGSFVMDTGQPLVVEVVRPGTTQVVGTYSGSIAGTGYAPRISTGESYRVNIVGGTSRCDGSASVLPAGKYQVIAQVMDETGVPPRYLTPPVPITVTRP
jgi:hypothetical protein